MSINVCNNNSMSAITSLPSGVGGGSLNLISTQTASSSSTISFTSGIDSTYDAYMFKFYDIHAATDSVDFVFNLSADSGSNYNVTKTSSYFRAWHSEAGDDTNLRYETGSDLAQGTGFQSLTNSDLGNGNDESCVGTLHLFNPSSTTFVKHFIATTNTYHSADYTFNSFIAGYANTTSAIDAVQFKMDSGNIDSGVIKLYGVS